MRLVRELLAKLLKHLLNDVANAIRHAMKDLLKHREVLIRHVSEILEVVDERSSSLLVLESHVAGDVGVSAALLTGAKFLVVNCRLVDLHRITLKVQLLVVDDIIANDGAQQLLQELAVARRANKAAEKLCPEEVATDELLQSRTAIDFFSE